jgi:hypothetical protein
VNANCSVDVSVERSHLTWLAVVAVISSAIPVYGWFTGHLAEMMGGRMMVWGIAWLLIVLVEVVILLAVGFVAIVGRQQA